MCSNLTVLIPMDIVHIEWTIEICLLTKYNRTNVNIIPKNPIINIGLWGKS